MSQDSLDPRFLGEGGTKPDINTVKSINPQIKRKLIWQGYINSGGVPYTTCVETAREAVADYLVTIYTPKVNYHSLMNYLVTRIISR